MYFVVWNTHTAGTEATRRNESDAMKAYLHNHSRVTLHHGGLHWTTMQRPLSAAS